MQRRDDRHGQARQQRHDVLAGLAAENAEFVLQRHDLEPAAVQEIGRPNIVFDTSVVDLKADGGRIVIDLTMIGHGDDGGFEIRTRVGDGVLQIGGECRDSASAGQ